MTWTIKERPHVAGVPITADYECPVHGRFEVLTERDANGDPPDAVPCPSETEDANFPYEYDDGDAAELICGMPSPWRISAPGIKRDSVPCYAAVKGGDTERRPGMLDTRPLAEGMSRKEWKTKQTAARNDRRHHQLIKRGLKTKRVQV